MISAFTERGLAGGEGNCTRLSALKAIVSIFGGWTLSGTVSGRLTVTTFPAERFPLLSTAVMVKKSLVPVRDHGVHAHHASRALGGNNLFVS